MELLQYDKGTYHRNCFKCQMCASTITNLKSVAMISGDLYCKNCFMKVFKEKGKYSSFNDRPHTGSTVTKPGDGKEPSSPPVKETSPTIKESSPKELSPSTLQIQRPTRSHSAQPPSSSSPQPIQSSPQMKLKHVELPPKQNNTVGGGEAKPVFEMPKRHVDPPKDLVEPKKQEQPAEQPAEQQQQQHQPAEQPAETQPEHKHVEEKHPEPEQPVEQPVTVVVEQPPTQESPQESEPQQQQEQPQEQVNTEQPPVEASA